MPIALVTRRMNGGFGFNGQSPLRGMEVGVANPAGFGLDHDLSGAGRRDVVVLGTRSGVLPNSA